MKKISVTVLSLLLAMTFLVSCSASTPQNVVSEKLQKLQNGEIMLSDVFSTTSEETTTASTEDKTDDSKSESESDSFYKAIFSSIKYEIGETKKEKNNNKDTATVAVKITVKDGEQALKNYLKDSLTHILDKSWTEDTSKIAEYVNDSSVATKNYDVVVKLTKTDDGWKINDVNDDFLNAITGGIYSSPLYSSILNK